MKKFKISKDTRVFYIADTHFGHANIIKHCNRPFESAEEMDAKMIRNWNSVVGVDDVVFVVGADLLDFTPKTYEQIVGK